jgi:hypothetical protein
MKILKNLSLVVFATLALMALPSTASALPGFIADEYPATYEGEINGNHVFGLNFGTFECNGPNFGSGAGGSSRTMTSSLAGGTCTMFSSTVAFNTNGCQLTYNPGTESSKGIFQGTFDIGPTGCGPMKIDSGWCKVSIGAQSNLKATYENVGTGSQAKVKIYAGVTGLKYTQSQTNFDGCVNGTFQNGTWNGGWTVSAKRPGVEQAIGMRVAEMRKGIYLTGQESNQKESQPKLEAESYPVKILGTQDAADKLLWGFDAGTAQCESAQLETQAAKSTAELASAAQFGGCTALNFAPGGVSIVMNSCKFALSVLNAGPPYTGALGIACSKEGDKIEVKTPGCIVTIGAQAGHPGLSLSNQGSGFERHIAVDANVAGIKYSEINKGIFPTCVNGGKTSENGTLSGGVTLEGSLL